MKHLKRIGALVAVLCLLAAPLTVAAQSTYGDIPVESYTYWEKVGSGSRKAVYSQPMYQVKAMVTAETLGVADFNSLSAVCTDTQGNIYLLDGAASRLVITDSRYTVLRELTAVDDNGTPLDFTGARDVYVRADGTIYLCDTDHARVLKCDAEGRLTGMLTLPESTLIPEGFNYAPIAVAVDSAGYAYVLCDGSYYGAILYTPEETFGGFYGANKVRKTVVQAFSTMLSRVFVNNAKKSVSQSELPFCFVDISIDREDFVYTATGYTDISGMKGQVKKLSPGNGTNILDSDSVNFADDGSNWTFRVGELLRQDITALTVDDQGFIYCLDSTYGRVYLYDQECHLLSAFGGGMGTGTQEGVFQKAVGLTLNGSDLLVCDGTKNALTVLALTPFGEQFKQARALTIGGKYLEAKPLWQEVLRQDSNCQLAYNGLARASLAEENYDAAMAYARKGYDRDTYDLAFSEVRTAFISRNFSWLLALAILVIGGLLVLMVVSMRRQFNLIKNPRLRLLFHMLAHPFDAFGTIKDKKQGSVLIGTVLLVLYYIGTVLADLCGGFSFTYVDLASYNSLFVFLRSVGVVLLWVICNKAVTALMDGKGTGKEIYVVTTYSLVPMILSRFVYLALSNALRSDEAEFLNIFCGVMLAWTLLLIVVGTIRIHDYGMGKFLGTTVLSVAGMAIVLFLLIMVFILSQQFIGFLTTLFLEIV